MAAATVERDPATLNVAAAELAREEVERELRVASAHERRKEGHRRSMERIFGDAQRTQRVNIRAAMQREARAYPDWYADVMHDESMAQPDFTLPALPDPPEGEFIWGASLTCIPEPRADFLLTLDAGLLGAVDAAVREAQEVFDWELGVQDLADVTGWPVSAVKGAHQRVRRAPGRPRG